MNGYIDMHCDTLSAALSCHKDTMTSLEGTMIDLNRLCQSSADTQFFAMFLSQGAKDGAYGYEKLPDLTTVMLDMWKVFDRSLKENADRLAFAGCYEDLLRNRAAGKRSAILTLENGYPVLGKMENLKWLHDLGVRLITLTWNDPNCFGQNHSSDPELMQKGLTDFGKEAISVMNELGILVDVSHLNDGGFYDVAKLSKKPFVASHSNCRALSPATRNLTDDMIRILAEKGGVSGINFCPAFLNADIEDPVSRIERMCDHVEHFIKVGGVECVGIGTDFDGIGGQLEIPECTKMDMLHYALHKRGLSDDVIDRIWSGNVERVIRDAMA